MNTDDQQKFTKLPRKTLGEEAESSPVTGVAPDPRASQSSHSEDDYQPQDLTLIYCPSREHAARGTRKRMRAAPTGPAGDYKAAGETGGPARYKEFFGRLF